MTNEDKSVADARKEISHTHDAITQLMMAAGCPSDCRIFIDGLVSIADDKLEFRISDLELAYRIRTDADDVEKTTLQKWIQRRRSKLEKWQEESGFVFVECERGGKDYKEGWMFSSLYRIPILDDAHRVITAARNNKALWQAEPRKAIKEAAIDLINDLRANPRTVNTKKKKSVDSPLRRIRRAKTDLVKAIEMIERGHELYHAQEELRELERLVESLREQVPPYF